jgi:S1-C subfamily serine protease
MVACSLCLSSVGPLQAQSLFPASPPQAESLSRTSSSMTATQGRTGTAFFVDDAGDMLTAGHVAAGCARVVVAKEGQAVAGRVVALSSQVDLALIKVPRTLGLSAVFPRSIKPGVNDMLFTADYANLAGMTARGGLLSNATLAANATRPGYLAIDSDATFGSSGAPVLDGRGLVQGVVSQRVVTLPQRNVTSERHVLAVDATLTKAFLGAHRIAIDEDDRPQIAASGSRANRAASISARVFCVQD